jgi:hypothetical protein
MGFIQWPDKHPGAQGAGGGGNGDVVGRDADQRNSEPV